MPWLAGDQGALRSRHYRCHVQDCRSNTILNPSAVAQYVQQLRLIRWARYCRKHASGLWETSNTIYPSFAEVPGFEVVKPQGPLSFPNVKGHGDERLHGCDRLITAILEEAEGLCNRSWFGDQKCPPSLCDRTLDTLKEESNAWKHLWVVRMIVDHFEIKVKDLQIWKDL